MPVSWLTKSTPAAGHTATASAQQTLTPVLAMSRTKEQITTDYFAPRPSTGDSLITMADFHLCLTSQSHSQAGYDHYAHE